MTPLCAESVAEQPVRQRAQIRLFAACDFQQSADCLVVNGYQVDAYDAAMRLLVNDDVIGEFACLTSNKRISEGLDVSRPSRVIACNDFDTRRPSGLFICGPNATRKAAGLPFASASTSELA
jgi:hypothetical protein